MPKKYKKVFAINLEPGFRNYTVRDLIDLKGKKKLSQIHVSTPHEAAAAEEAGIDLLLVRAFPGLEEIRKAAKKTFISVSIPFIKYASKYDIVKDSLEVVDLGFDSITCGSWNLDFMKYLNGFNIPMQGHAGLVPRKSTWTGGVKAVGKTFKSAMQLYEEVKLIEKTGAWSVEIECVPSKVMKIISNNTSMVTVSIGSGYDGDVQFLFAEDILGHGSINLPRHAKQYRNFKKIFDNLQKERVKAFKEYKRDIMDKKFPTKSNTIDIEDNELKKFSDSFLK
tara:strand:- start:456 stop:1295 length:840 start_codon:yes stop_codon:yes gene_type:complete